MEHLTEIFVWHQPKFCPVFAVYEMPPVVEGDEVSEPADCR